MTEDGILRYKTLLYQLTRREFKARYNSAKLGVAWAVLNPLLLMGILTVVFSKFVRIETGATPYPVFVLSGLIVWQAFRAAVATGASCIVDDRDLFKRIPFPRSIVPLSIVLSSLINLALSVPILLVVMALLGSPFHLTALLAPVGFIVLAALMTGAALVVSAATVYYRDVRYLVEPLLLVLFYASPIFYPLDLVPARLAPFYELNPMVGAIVFLREAVVVGTITSWRALGISSLFALAMIGFGAWLYRRYSRVFVDML